MVFEKPNVEFVEIEEEEILADTGSGIHICQGNQTNFGPGDCTQAGALLPYCEPEANFNH